MSERFYINCPLGPGRIQLQGPEAHHLGTVCRVRPGALVSLFNGDGCQYPARVLSVARKQVELEILDAETIDTELPFRLEVAAPLPKGDRAQFLIEKLTELGVASFVPLQTKRSVIDPRESRIEKLQRSVIEASKQCRRNVLLRIESPVSWDHYVDRNASAPCKLIAHVGEADRMIPAQADATIAVGPEGGFTDDEVEAARRHGWQVTGLGRRILRVETAALLLTAWVIRA